VLADDTGQSPQKITKDFQAYEMLLRLAPHGITVSSDLMPTDKRRQQGVALPEYHAVLVHQAMSALAAEGAVTEAETEERMVELAHLIAPMSQEAAKKLMEQVKAGDQPARHSLHHIAEELVPFRQRNAGRHGASRPKKSSFKRRENGGLVTCSCCNRILQLAHLENGTHHVSDTPFMRQPQLPAPVFSPEPGAAALPPAPAASDAAPALSAMGTPEPILKMTAGYTLDAFPKGLGAVLTLHNSGFWGKLGRHPARPDFKATDIPQSIWTLDPWLGCVYGTSCRFCYVPTLCARIYPDGKQSYWYQQWGNWLIYKPDITNRLRRQLMDGAGHTRPAYQGAAVYMSPKTDPLVPITDALAITAQNLDVFLDADIFLMIQTRSKAVAESDPDIFNRIVELGRRKKVGISFSISTDLLDQQRRIESGGLLPDERLRIMARLKQAGLFVSAAVAPLMPYSPDFARKLVESCHHASIQVLHLIGSGAATPKPLLTQMHKEIPHYRELERKLAEEIEAVDGTAEFSWGINNKGFIGAFLAAHRFYKTG
jgi:DNA repair photolyase